VNRRTFERLVERAMTRIPAEFLVRIDNLSVQVEGWAPPEVLAEVGFDDARDLLGYYRGWALPDRGVDYGGALPDTILLYQYAIEDYAADSGEPLLKVIRETLLHELAHYFGFSEEEMDAIERLWASEAGDEGPQTPP